MIWLGWSFLLVANAERLAEGVTVADYNKAGILINDTLKILSIKMKHDPDVLEIAFHPDFATLQTGDVTFSEVIGHGIQVGSRTQNQSFVGAAAAIEWFQDLALDYRTATVWQWKLVDIIHIDENLHTQARFRYEVGGNGETERGEFIGEFRPMNDSYLLYDANLVSAVTSRGSGDSFHETAMERGIDFYGESDSRFLPPSDKLKFQTSRHSIGGVSVGDVNADGWDDILFVGGGKAVFYQNMGQGNFIDATSEVGLDNIFHANNATFADLDNDGDQDLLLTVFIGGNKLYRNDAGVFTDITIQAGLGPEDNVSVAAVVDIDNDGLLDLYLGRFIDIRKDVPNMIHYTRNGQPNQLYRNKGGLHFENITVQSGAGDVGLALGLAVGDYDSDGDQDIYIANDFGRNVLLQNQGDLTFKDVAKESGSLAVSGGMSANFGDFNNDGFLDLYISSIRSNQRWFSQDLNIRTYIMNIVESNRRKELMDTFVDLRKHLGTRWAEVGQKALSGNYLLQNNGDGTFTDVSDRSGTRVNGWYWGAGFVDVDNDGLLDVYAVNGWISGEDTHDL